MSENTNRAAMGKDYMLLFYCPACGTEHGVYVANPRGERRPVWKWNNSLTQPTLMPSVRVQWGDATGNKVCHFHVAEGKISYCGDSTHLLAGKTVDLPSYTEEA